MNGWLRMPSIPRECRGKADEEDRRLRYEDCIKSDVERTGEERTREQHPQRQVTVYCR